ncbi:MAG: ABC transporter substrate-binding protein [Acholeplasmataceae bacterium]|nr:ABC transporter substrate-binding protein [Acholeplasmataceae bacterium]
MKKVFLLFVLLAAVFTIAACQNDDKIIVQGVTDTEILIGNTAATSGNFAGVGIPFNNGLEAYLHHVNTNGGVNGRTIRFVTYDDGFDATQGLTLTKKLVEEDKVFALVGHFGTPTVGATIEYIQDIGVPMVYAATGINDLYFEESAGNPVMAVQPIYKTDGRIMTARALNEALFGANSDAKLPASAKVGVLHTSTDDGMSLKEGIETEAAFSDRSANFIYKSFAADNTAALDAAVLDLKDQGVQAIIVASNQNPFKAAVRSLQTNALHVPVFTSYVNADATSIDATIDYSFDIYANAWVDIMKNSMADLTEFYAIMAAAEKDAVTGVAYAIAGYIAAKVFVEGLERVGEDELVWESYIDAMEEGPIDIPMGGTVDFSGGKRWGIASMSLLKLSTTPVADSNPQTYTHSWAANKPIETLETIQAK